MRLLSTLCMSIGLSLGLGGAVQAQSTLSVGSLNADGVSARDLECTLTNGSFMASVQLLGAFKEELKALSACGPQGEAVRVSMRLDGQAFQEVKTLAASEAKAGACVAKVAAKLKSSLKGACALTLLTVDNARAQAAVEKLNPKAPTKPH